MLRQLFYLALFSCLLPASSALAQDPFVCVDQATVLCLQDQRFEVSVEWRDFDGQSGMGQVVPVESTDSGLFWFFQADNWELLIKVLDGCQVNDRLWVFAAATTNVEYSLRVKDFASGEVKEYFNPLGTAALALTDTDAFATCSATIPASIVLTASRAVISADQENRIDLVAHVVNVQGFPISAESVLFTSSIGELERGGMVVTDLGEATDTLVVTAEQAAAVRDSNFEVTASVVGADGVLEERVTIQVF